MDCGVPFCHSTQHGCPLGNIIPKFNDLVTKSSPKNPLKSIKIMEYFLLQVSRYVPKPLISAWVLMNWKQYIFLHSWSFQIYLLFLFVINTWNWSCLNRNKCWQKIFLAYTLFLLFLISTSGSKQKINDSCFRFSETTGARLWTSCCRPTTSPSSLAESARPPAKAPVFWSVRFRLT